MAAPQPNVPALTTSMNNINLNEVSQDTAQHPNIPILEQLNTMQTQINQLANQMQINHAETTNALAVLAA